MSGIRIDTLEQAYTALMRVWRMPTEPVPVGLKLECMNAAVSIRAQLDLIDTRVAVTGAASEKVPA